MIRRCLTYMGVIALASTATVIGAPGIASADEIRDAQWHLEELGINDAHELSQGEGVTIGVIDSGIDATHPDLENNVEAGKDYGKSKDDGLNDAEDHGTGVTSVLAGHGHGNDNEDGIVGIAPKAEIISVGIDCKAPCRQGGGYISDGIEWLIDEGVDLISISQSASDSNSDALEYADENDVPVVASAGNTRKDHGAEIGVVEESATAWPGRGIGAIPVTATTSDNEFWDGSRTLKNAATQPQFGLSAPGAEIPYAAAGGGYNTNSGTSLATPIVAGTLALIKSAYPDLDYTTWVARMLETVDDKGEEGYDDKYGHGIVNPLEALTEDVRFKDEYSDIESLAEDRLPLEEQGKGTSGDSGDEGNDDEGTADGNPIAAATNALPMWMIVAIIVGLLIVTAGIITTVVLTQRRKKRQVGHNEPPSGGIPGPGGPAGPGSPPPGPPSGPPQPNPANPTAAPPPGNGNPPPASTPPGPPPPGDGSGSPASAPSATQHNPQTPPAGQPNVPPQQPPAPGQPQANPPGDATPPGTNAPFTPPQ